MVLTDHPWPDVTIERELIEGAGYQLIAGPVTAGSAQQVEALVAEHDPVAIMTCWAQVSEQAIQLPSQLRIVARMGVGLDNIQVAAATERGAWVTNVPDYCVEEVSDHAIALLLAAWRGVAYLDGRAKQGEWRPEAAPSLKRVREQCVAIIGYGRTGALTARKLREGFGCQVLVNSPSLLRRYADGTALTSHIQVANWQRIQQQADAIVLHLPLTPTSQHLIDHEFLQGCRRQPWLVNVSRGGLVDTAALMAALSCGQVSGAALDVVEGEPAPPVELLQRPEVIITPHIAFSSAASLRELRIRVCEEVLRVLHGGQPLHPCNRLNN